jgi:FkbM family methyltransferase
MIYTAAEMLDAGVLTASHFDRRAARQGQALMAYQPGATLKLTASGEKVWLRFLQHPWSGAVRIKHDHGEDLHSLKSEGEQSYGVCLTGRDGRITAEVTVEELHGNTEAWLLNGLFSEWQDRQELTVRASETCHLSIAKHGSYLTLSSDSVIGRAIREEGAWADSDLKLISRHIKPGDTVLDIGANIGHHVVAFSRMVGPGGRVLGFEPQRLIFQLACGNAALNGCRNASLLHCGLGAEPGVARMNPVNYADEFNFGSLAIAEDATGEPVQIRTLDEAIKSEGLSRVDFMKIDVQSYELFVLKGGVETIRRYKPRIFMEIAPEQMSGAGYHYTAVYDLLREYGYVFDHLDGSEPSPEPRTPSGRAGEEWDVLAMVQRDKVEADAPACSDVEAA